MNPLKITFIIGAGLIAMGCEQKPKTYSLQEIKQICEEERRDAQGPRTNVSIGANSRTGMVGGLSVNFNDKFIRGVDPDVAYKQCLERFTPVQTPTPTTQSKG